VLNGSFEDWVWDSSGFVPGYVPEHWEVWDFWRENSIVKDTIASHGSFSVIMRDGVDAQHEGDCARDIYSTFDLKSTTCDSLRISFMYIGKTIIEREPAGIYLQVGGVTTSLKNLEDSISIYTKADEPAFQKYIATVAFPSDSILNIAFRSRAHSSALDGCYHIGNHWIDELEVAYLNDNDLDGYLSDVDCDDTDPSVSPDQIEIPYNGIDDDCNPETLDDDLDQDGYLSADDCDDNNFNIHPDADEIPNNAIDENCDGMDLISSTYELSNSRINIYPNPASEVIYLDVMGQLNYTVTLYNIEGNLITTSRNISNIDVNSIAVGTYILELQDVKSGQKVVERIVIKK